MTDIEDPPRPKANRRERVAAGLAPLALLCVGLLAAWSPGRLFVAGRAVSAPVFGGQGRRVVEFSSPWQATWVAYFRPSDPPVERDDWALLIGRADGWRDGGVPVFSAVASVPLPPAAEALAAVLASLPARARSAPASMHFVAAALILMSAPAVAEVLSFLVATALVFLPAMLAGALAWAQAGSAWCGLGAAGAALVPSIVLVRRCGTLRVPTFSRLAALLIVTPMLPPDGIGLLLGAAVVVAPRRLGTPLLALAALRGPWLPTPAAEVKALALMVCFVFAWDYRQHWLGLLGRLRALKDRLPVLKSRKCRKFTKWSSEPA